MAIEYAFLDRGPEALLQLSELPVEDGIAIAVRTTGYELGTDEAVELAIVDLAGNELFSRIVKPQNIEQWQPSASSGNLSPEDVAEAPELYQFEDEISALFEKASIVVGQHVEFAREMIEASWVSLPPFEEFDLDEQFRLSHETRDYPGQTAAAATLQGMANYYGTGTVGEGALDEARAVASCYQALVREHAQVRLAKGDAYWQDYRRSQEEARLQDEDVQAQQRLSTAKALRINAALWLCAAVVFGNLAVQLHLRSFDFGFVALAIAGAAYFAVRCILSMRDLMRLSGK